MNRTRYTALSKGRTGKRGKMNRTETKYSDELTARKLAGEIVQFWFEPFSLRLTSNVEGSKTKPARYTPDFMVLYPDGLTEIVDVKGTGPDDIAGDVRMKAAAELFPLWRFIKAKQRKVRDGGGFVRIEV